RTGEFAPREVESETFRTMTLETRVRAEHRVAGRNATLSTGARVSGGRMRRYEGGEGTRGSDFDLSLAAGDWERALRLHTTNVAGFAEELWRATDRLSIVPGVRLEWVRSTASGYTDVASSFAPRSYVVPLGGVGVGYITSPSTELYANLAQ